MAQALERACFDYMMLEDTLMLSDAYGHSTESYLKNAIMVPKHDPAPMAALIGAATQKLGIVANVGTLVAPITRAQYLSGGAAVPPQLFSLAGLETRAKADVMQQSGFVI